MHRIPLHATITNISKVVIIAGLYILSALVSFLTMLNPSNTPIAWIPSGLALAVILIWGWPAAVGILIGSIFAFSFLSLPPFAIAILVSGQLLQGLFASGLHKRYVRQLLPETVAQTLAAWGLFILTGLLLTFLLTCLRFYLGWLPLGDLPNHFWLWSLSSISGTMLVTPTLVYLWNNGRFLLEIPTNPQRKNHSMGSFLWPLCSIIIGVSLTSTLIINNNDQQQTLDNLEANTSEVTKIIQNSLDQHIKDLYSVSAFFHSTTQLNQKDFKQITSSLLLDSPAAVGFAYIPRVSLTDRPMYEEFQTKQGFLDYSIFEIDSNGNSRPSALHTEYFPIEFIQPIEDYKTAFGFDLNSEPSLRDAIQRARDSGLPTTTESLHLVQITKNQDNILIIVPIYKNEALTDTIQLRRANILGFVTGIYRTKEILSTIQITITNHDMETYLFDLGNPTHSQLLAFSPSISSPQTLPDAETTTPASLQMGLYNTKTLQVADRKWLLITRPGETDFSIMDELIQVAILLIGFGLSVSLLSYAKNRQNTETIMARSAAEFKSLSENALTGVVKLHVSGKILYINQAAAEIFGMYSAVDMVGKNIRAFLKNRADYRTQLDKLRTSSQIRNQEMVIHTKQDQHRNILYSTSVIENEIYISFVDISARVLAEQENRQLSSVVSQMANPVVISKINGEIEYVNPAFELLTGYTLAETLGKTPRVLKSGLMPDEFYQSLWTTILSGDVFEGEFINRKKNGEIFFEIKTITPVMDAKGSITHFISTGKDITERKQAELLQETVYVIAEDAQNSESLHEFYSQIHRRISSVMNAQNFYIALYDEEHDTLRFEFSIDEYGSYDPSPFPAETGLTEYVLKTGQSLLCDDAKAEELINQGAYNPRGNASSTWLGVPLIAISKTIGVMAVQHYQDPFAYTEREQRILEFVSSQVATVIARKQAEETAHMVEKRNTALIQNAPDGIALIDSDGIIFFGSPSLYRLFGYQPQNVIGNNFFDYIHPEDLTLVESALTNLVNNPQAILNIQYRGLHEDGTYHWIESILSNLLDEPSVNAIVNNFHDITETRQASERLRKSQESLEMAQAVAHLGNWEFDPASGVIFWSKEVFKLFNLNPEDGTPSMEVWLEMIHPDDQLSVLEAQKTSMDLHEPVTFIFRVTTQNHLRYFEARIQSNMDSLGQLTTISGTLMDVTERSEMEQEIRQRVMELTCLFNVSSLLEYNSNTEEVVCQEILDNTLTAIHDPNLATVCLDLNGNRYTTRTLYTDELPYNLTAAIMVAGEQRGRLCIFYTQKVAPLIPEQQALIDNLARMLGLWLERRQSELALRDSNDRFSQLVENIKEVFWMTDARQRKLTYISPSYQTIWDRSIQSAFDNPDEFFDSIFPEDLPIQKAASAKQANGENSDIEYRIRRPDGSIRWIWDRAFPILDHEGKRIRTAGVSTDITDLKNSQQALLELNRDLEKRVEERTAEVRQSESTYRALFENSNDGIFIMSPEGIELRANQRGLEMFGYTQEEWHNIPSAQLVLDKDKQHAAEHIQAVARGEQVPLYERTVIKKDGSLMDVEINLSPVRAADGTIVLVQSVVRDISDRKRTEEALKASSELFYKFMRYSPIYTFIKEVTQERSLVLYASQNFFEMIGPPGHDMIGKTMHDLFPPEFADKITADDWDVVSRGEMVTLEEYLNNRSYTTIKFPIIEGNRTLLAGYTIDITDRKKAEESLRESEERYRKAISTAEAVPYSFDYAQNSYTFMGEGIERLTGYTRDEMTPEFLVSLVLESQYQGDLEGLDSTDFTRMIRTGEINPTRALRNDFHILDKNGRHRWLSDSSVQVLDEKGLTTGSIGILLDITDRKEAEETLRDSRDQLRAANAALEKASRMKDEFLASMSHELRTPLTGILGLAEAMQMQTQGSLTEKQLKAMKNIEKCGRHLLELINDILDLSKIEAGKLDIEMGICSVSDVCQSSLQLVKGMAGQKMHNISFKMNSTPILLRVDIRRLKQMLVNLLSNAIKFTPEGKQIGLEVEANQELKIIRFTVWDQGIGIKPEGIKRLFQPFVQLDSSLSRQYEGTGLGLSLVKRMAELQGGSVQVNSVFGEGSRFSILLPWLVDEPNSQSENRGKDPHSALENGERRDASFLDYGEIRDYLKEIGYSNIVLPIISDVLDKAANLQPSAILLDMNLPDNSCLDLLARIKADNRTHNIPVILLSNKVFQTEASRLGADGYLVGPFTQNDLRAGLKKTISIQPDQTVILVGNNTSIPLVLMADDNDLFLETASEFLLGSGFRVVTAHNGFELLEKAPSLAPDIILVDIQMPGLNGIDTIRRLRANDNSKIASTPVIAITALAMSGDKERCLEAGANEYMSKPVSFKILVKIMTRLLTTNNPNND